MDKVEDRKINKESNAVVQLRKYRSELEHLLLFRGCRCGTEGRRCFSVRVLKKVRGMKEKLINKLQVVVFCSRIIEEEQGDIRVRGADQEINYWLTS